MSCRGLRGPGYINSACVKIGVKPGSVGVRSMKKFVRGALVWMTFVLSCAALAGEASAGPLEDGVAATKRGDFETALKDWQPLAQAGDAQAQVNIGLLYEHGWGVAQDFAQAVKWFRLAAAQGLGEGQNNLGQMYAFGRGVTQDWMRAYVWFNLSAAQGDAKAAKNLEIAKANLTAAKLAQAQALATKCKASNYKDCG